jgi:hypothetical protein
MATTHELQHTEAEALNDNAKGGIDRFGYRAYAEGLCDVLKKGEPPLCVGLYAKWGSGKSFMISLIKKGFDPTARENKHTHELTQWFEDGYDKLTPAVSDTAAANEIMEVARREHEQKNKRERQRDGQYSNWYCLEMMPRRIWMCLALTGATITTTPMPPQLVPLWVNTLRTVCIEEFTDVWQAVDEWLWRFAPCEMKYLHRCCRTDCSGRGSGRFTPRFVCGTLMLAVVWAAVGTAIAAGYMPDSVREQANRVSKTPHWWLMAIAAACALLAVLVSIAVQVVLVPSATSGGYSKVASSETQDATTPEPQRKEYVFVDFNAWEFAGSDELWTGLIRNMYDKVEKRLAKKRRSEEANDAEWKVRWRVKKAIKLLKNKYNVRAYAMLLALGQSHPHDSSDRGAGSMRNDQYFERNAFCKPACGGARGWHHRFHRRCSADSWLCLTEPPRCKYEPWFRDLRAGEGSEGPPRFHESGERRIAGALRVSV